MPIKSLTGLTGQHEYLTAEFCCGNSQINGCWPLKYVKRLVVFLKYSA